MISLITPTHSRAEVLYTRLYALPRQSFKDFEVIVVMDACEDDTEAMLSRSWVNDLPYAFHYTKTEPLHGVSHARNLGASLARGDLLVFQDDDIIPDPDCLMEISRLMRPGIAAVGYCSPTHDARIMSGQPIVRNFITQNIAVWKSDFNSIGGFSTDFIGWGGEDIDLGRRLEDAGISLAYARNARSMQLWDVPYNIHPKSSDQKWREYYANIARIERCI